MNIQMKRIYDPVRPTDGFRVLVDRLWPRGISKERAQIDLWAKDIAPSTQLRKDLHSGKDNWAAFEALYQMELSANPGLPELIETLERHKTVTLLFAAKDTEHTHVKVLMDAIHDRRNRCACSDG